MSKATELLEAAVAEVIANRPAEGERQTARQRMQADRAFATVLQVIAPRIRHFIKQYGLTAHWEDAEQVCAIGVHRAIEAYDPEKAMFTTFVNWQLRGELQGLRFRLMDDQRPSAKKVEATTISLHAMERGADGEDMPLEAMIEDEFAEGRTEASAADHMARQTCSALMDEYVCHLRSVGIAQLKRKAQSARPLATRRDRSSALPVYVQSRAGGGPGGAAQAGGADRARLRHRPPSSVRPGRGERARGGNGPDAGTHPPDHPPRRAPDRRAGIPQCPFFQR